MSTETSTDHGPFLIDGPEYSDRDREMFVLGVEYARIMQDVARKPGGTVVRTIHRDNAGRARALCEANGVECRIRLDPADVACIWRTLEINPKRSP